MDRPDDETVLNHGLFLAMEWGADWLRPIDARLSRSYPDLTPDECAALNAVCQAAMRFGHALIHSMAQPNAREDALAPAGAENWKRGMLAKYPWVNAANLGRLFSQSVYYARK